MFEYVLAWTVYWKSPQRWETHDVVANLLNNLVRNVW